MTAPSCVPAHSSALPTAHDSDAHCSRNQLLCHSSNSLGYISRVDPARSFSLTSAAASTTPLQDLPSPLLLFLDVTCPDLKNVLANAPLTFTCKSTSPLKNVLANSLVTSTLKSPHCWLHKIREGSPLWQGFLSVAQSSCSCKLDTAIRCHTSCWIGRPLWAGFCFLRGTVSAQILPKSATRPVGQDAVTGWDQLFPIFLWPRFPIN